MNNLDDFLKQVFAFLLRKLGEQVDRETALRVARRVLEDMHLGTHETSWDSAQPVTVRTAKRRELMGTAIRISGQVAQLHDPEVISVPEADGTWTDAETTCVEIEDHAGSRVWALDVMGRALIDAVQQIHEQHAVAEFLGVMLLLPARVSSRRPETVSGDNRREFVFQVLGVRPSESAFDLLAASQEEREQASDLLDSLRRSSISPRDHLIARVVEGLRIVGLEELHVLRSTIDFAVLQALGVGRIGNSPANLHGLIVGPPGHGKKLPLLAAQALNPTAQVLSSSKCTPAGLVGASYRTDAGWRSTPGAIPRSAHGVLLMQDAHGWAPNDTRRMAPILQSVMEDGIVHDSVAGGRSWSAPVATIMDMNRTTHVDPRSRAPEAALLRVLPLLSRMDAILEIPADVERAWSMAARTYDGLSNESVPPLQQPWVRQARLLVAALRHAIPSVSTESVRSLMRDAHTQLFEKNRALLMGSPTEATALPMRLAVSFGRLVSASSRADGRAEAQPQDVDVALQFLTSKLEFMRLHGLTPSDQYANFKQKREDFVRRHAGTVIDPSDIATKYEQETGEAVSEKTIRRDLAQLGASRVGKSAYKLPDAGSEPTGS